jgi:putative FmdB family regulatory protein
MPIYEYRCQECEEEFEKLVLSPSANKPVECPHCGSEKVNKVISLFGVGNSSQDLSAASCGPGPV